MPNIHKLKYADRETGISDLKAKGIIDEDGNNLQGTHAVVEVGKIVLVDGIYDEEGNEITAPIYIEGYHFDIMIDSEMVFENEIVVDNPKHMFAL
jgi:hypothetical protein